MSKQNNRPKVERYRITANDDSSHQVLWSFKLTRPGLSLAVTLAVILGLLAAYALFAFTPLKTFIPGYPDAHTRRAAVQNAITVDSLQTVISRWELYSQNLVNVLEGKDPVKLDSLIARSEKNLNEQKLASADSLLRQNVLEEQQFEISGREKHHTAIEGLHFFTPVKLGVITKAYEEILHPYVDISAPANSVVMAALGGTVLEAYWNDEYGYSMVIQHENNIVTIYRHNQRLLKKTGDKVSAGTAIAIVGQNSPEGNPDHLHFELWYNGESVNPTLYINF